MSRTRRFFPLTLAFIALLNVGLHLYAAGNLEYHRDELLYFALGFHPDWGYASVPPLIGWIAGGVRLLFGTGVWAVKLLPALLSGVLIYLIAGIVRELRGGDFAVLLAAAAALLMPALLRFFHLFQPVHLDILWWTVLVWLSLPFENTGRPRYLLFLLPAAGILLGWLLFRPATHREPYLGLAALFALLVLLLLRGKSYYFLGFFPALTAAGAVWWEGLVGARRFKWVLTAAILLLNLPPVGGRPTTRPAPRLRRSARLGRAGRED